MRRVWVRERLVSRTGVIDSFQHFATASPIRGHLLGRTILYTPALYVCVVGDASEFWTQHRGASCRFTSWGYLYFPQNRRGEYDGPTLGILAVTSVTRRFSR